MPINDAASSQDSRRVIPFPLPEPTTPAANASARPAPSVATRYYWLATVAVIAVVHTPSDVVRLALARLLAWMSGASLPENAILASDLNADYAVPLRQVTFYLGLALLLVPLILELRASLSAMAGARWRSWGKAAALAFAALSLLTSPLNHPNIEVGMGVVYAENSAQPFDISMTWEYRRMLKPALAHLLQLDHPLTYFIFSLALTVALMVAVRALLATDPDGNLTSDRRESEQVPWLLYLSFCTSSMVFFDFSSPGWADQLVFLFILAGWLLPLGDRSRLTLVTLALVTHEAALFLVAPLVLLRYPRRLWLQVGAIMITYFGMMWLSNGGSAMPTVKAHGMSQVWDDWRFNTGRVLLGIAMGFKLLWLVPPLAVLCEGRSRSWFSHLWPAVWIVVPLALTFVAWDYSRLAAWAFIGVAIYLVRLWTAVQHRPMLRRLVYALFVLNLLVPSTNIYTAPVPSPGLYRWMLQHCPDFLKLPQR